MPIGARGEGIIQAGEQEVRVLFTNRVLAEAERRLGKSVLAVAQGFSDNSTGLSDVVLLLTSGMQAARRDGQQGGPPVTLDTAYEVLDAAGFGAVASAVMEAVAAVLGYDGTEAEPDPNG